MAVILVDMLFDFQVILKFNQDLYLRMRISNSQKCSPPYLSLSQSHSWGDGVGVGGRSLDCGCCVPVRAWFLHLSVNINSGYEKIGGIYSVSTLIFRCNSSCPPLWRIKPYLLMKPTMNYYCLNRNLLFCLLVQGHEDCKMIRWQPQLQV